MSFRSSNWNFFSIEISRKGVIAVILLYGLLKGRDRYRVRVANYRIIYEIQDSVLLVDVIDLGQRKDIY